jgi:hypothetical protein
MQCRSGRWQPTSRHWTMSGNFPRCSQVRHTLRQKTGRRLSGRKDGHSGCSLASKCSRVWPCSLFLYIHHRLLPRLPDPHGVGAVRTTAAGYQNRNGQTVVRSTGLAGTDHGQSVYVLQCGGCRHEYGANGSDIFQRRCPACQGGRPGLVY